MYLEHLWSIFDECRRVLKDTGTLWVNLGDSYGGSGGNHKAWHKNDVGFQGKVGSRCGGIGTQNANVTSKSLCCIPERFAIGMVDNGSWILRNKIVWYKKNAMPSSAKDRFTMDWEYVFFFTKQGRYYFEQQFEPYTEPLDRWGGDNLEDNGNSTWSEGTGQPLYRNRSLRPNKQGRNKRCVWTINTKGYKEAHFATFPEKLVEPMIKSGCPEGGVVYDPFMGSSTVAVVAKQLGRHWVGSELNPDYIEMAERRIGSVQPELFI